jgi:hypothetical protein
LRESCEAELTSSLVQRNERRLILEKGRKIKVDAIGDERTVGKDCQCRLIFDVIGYYFPEDGKNPVRVRVMSETFAKAIK